MAAVAWAAAARASAASAATVAAARTASAAVVVSDALARSRPCRSGRMWVLGIAATFCGLFWLPGKKMKRPAAWPDTLLLSRQASLLSAPVRPAVVRAALGLPSGSLVLETETKGARLGRSPSPALQESRERQIGATLGCSCVGYTVGDTELGVGRVLELGETGKGATSFQPSQVTQCLWPPKRAATLTGERLAGQSSAGGGGAALPD